MHILISHIKKDDKGNTICLDNKPVISITKVQLPIKFGYGSYNQPKKIINIDINIENIVGISAEEES